MNYSYSSCEEAHEHMTYLGNGSSWSGRWRQREQREKWMSENMREQNKEQEEGRLANSHDSKAPKRQDQYWLMEAQIENRREKKVEVLLTVMRNDGLQYWLSWQWEQTFCPCLLLTNLFLWRFFFFSFSSLAVLPLPCYLTGTRSLFVRVFHAEIRIRL